MRVYAKHNTLVFVRLLLEEEKVFRFGRRVAGYLSKLEHLEGHRGIICWALNYDLDFVIFTQFKYSICLLIIRVLNIVILNYSGNHTKKLQ